LRFLDRFERRKTLEHTGIREFKDSGKARALAISPDGRSVLVVKDMPLNPQLDNLELWDSRSGRRQHRFRLTYTPEDADCLTYKTIISHMADEFFGGKIARVHRWKLAILVFLAV
jgi:hypothetical protein